MKRFIQKPLCFALVLAVSPLGLYAEETSGGVSSPLGTQNSSGELKWRRDIQEAKDTRAGLLTMGAITGVGGAIVIVAGNLKAASAEDVEGCTREGLFTVSCDNQASVDQAQSRIDAGRRLAVVGLVSALVGVGFLWGAGRQTTKIDELEKAGRQQGYKLSLIPRGAQGVGVMVSRAF